MYRCPQCKAMTGKPADCAACGVAMVADDDEIEAEPFGDWLTKMGFDESTLSSTQSHSLRRLYESEQKEMLAQSGDGKYPDILIDAEAVPTRAADLEAGSIPDIHCIPPEDAVRSDDEVDLD